MAIIIPLNGTQHIVGYRFKIHRQRRRIRVICWDTLGAYILASVFLLL
jgi:hypothetical protein